MQMFLLAEVRSLFEMPVKDLIKSFAQNSTAHGIPKVVKSKSLIGRLFWSVTCIVAIVTFLVQGVVLLQLFLTWPTQVQVTVVNQPITFPSVSICNLRPMDIYSLLDIFYSEDQMPRWNFTEDLYYKGRDNTTSDFEKQIVKFSTLINVYRNFADIHAEKEEISFLRWKTERDLLSRMTIAANLNVSAIEQGGIKSVEFIARCQYAGEKCTSDDFDWFVDPAYFNCFTFNSSRMIDEAHTMYEGPENGLSLILFVPGIDIMNYTGETLNNIATYQELALGGEGIRVVIHRQNTFPYPLTEGLDIPRGVSASVGLRLRENVRMKPPHGNCTDRETLVNTSYTYTMASCKKYCLQQTVQQACNCTDVSLPYMNTERYSFCSRFDPIPDICFSKQNITENYEYCEEIYMKWFDRVQCLKSTRSNISRNLSAWQECKCTAPCHDVDYDITYSLSDWPMQEQPKYILQDILIVDKFAENFPAAKKSKYFKSLDNMSETFQNYKEFIAKKHFLRLNVYISDTSVIKFSETEGYFITELVADLGGQMSLWIGLSIITLVETLELLYDVIIYLFHRKAVSNVDDLSVDPYSSKASETSHNTTI